MSTGAVGVVLDWPASVNRAIGGGVRNAVQVNREKQSYKTMAYYAARVQCSRAGFCFEGIKEPTKVATAIGFYPPDLRKRDIDNPIKWTLDAIEYAGLVENDSQIVMLSVYWLEPVPHGQVAVICAPVDTGSEAAAEFDAVRGVLEEMIVAHTGN